MSCLEWELRLAEGAEGEDAEAHLAECPSCRALAAELRENSAVLAEMREFDVPPVVIRPRVHSWKWVAAVAAMLAVGFGLREALRPVRVPAAPVAVTAQVNEPVRPVEPAMPVVARREAPRVDRAAVPRKNLHPVLTDPLTIRIQTSDPTVVIYWQMQSDEGDKI